MLHIDFVLSCKPQTQGPFSKLTVLRSPWGAKTSGNLKGYTYTTQQSPQPGVLLASVGKYVPGHILPRNRKPAARLQIPETNRPEA